MATKTAIKKKKPPAKKKATEVLKPDEIAQVKKAYRSVRKDAAELCEEMGENPFERLVDVAAGKGLTEDHPYLPKMKSKMKKFISMLEKGETIPVEQMKEFMEELENQLTDKHVPHELRIKAMIETTKYILPQLQKIETRNENLTINYNVTPDDIAKDAELIKRMINDR